MTRLSTSANTSLTDLILRPDAGQVSNYYLPTSRLPSWNGSIATRCRPGSTYQHHLLRLPRAISLFQCRSRRKTRLSPTLDISSSPHFWLAGGEEESNRFSFPPPGFNFHFLGAFTQLWTIAAFYIRTETIDKLFLFLNLLLLIHISFSLALYSGGTLLQIKTVRFP